MSKNKLSLSTPGTNAVAVTTAVLLITLSSVTLLFSQTPKPAERAPVASEKTSQAKPTPRGADGRPDFNGFWNQVSANQFAQRAADGSILYEFSINFDETIEVCVDDSCQLSNQPPYKPEVMSKVKEIAATQYLGTSPLDPQMFCKPHGVPRTGLGGMQIVQTPKVTALLYEGAPSFLFRIIYTDGRPHPKDLETSFMGHSIGHWEGDTLVVDVTGLNDETWLGGGSHGRTKYTSIHSDKLHVVERWTREGDVMTNQVTVEDPVMFTRPWVLAPRKVRLAKANDYLGESICSLNNAGQTHMVIPTENDKGQLYVGSKANSLKK